jgi:acyl-CoA dehydrogenase
MSDVAVTATGRNYAGEPWADVAVDAVLDADRSRVANGPGDGSGADAARVAGALSRAALMAGALQHAVDLSVQYAQEREQFGRPIGRFQILQHYLAEMAGEAAAARAAVENATDVAASGAADDDVTLAVAAAKAYAGRAVATINRLAHQLHGAIGFTDEHRLQYTTRRLWAWRDEHGTDAEWAAVLGRAVGQAGGDALWDRVTSWPPAVG